MMTTLHEAIVITKNRIFDVMGNEMMWQKTIEAETKINIEKLMPGFYFLNCADGNKMVSNKLVKF